MEPNASDMWSLNPPVPTGYVPRKPITPNPDMTASPLGHQVNGDHYKNLKIQPVEFIHANGIPFMEGCAIKYLTRWRSKGGIADLQKAQHFIELLIELESKACQK